MMKYENVAAMQLPEGKPAGGPQISWNNLAEGTNDEGELIHLRFSEVKNAYYVTVNGCLIGEDLPNGAYVEDQGEAGIRFACQFAM